MSPGDGRISQGRHMTDMTGTPGGQQVAVDQLISSSFNHPSKVRESSITKKRPSDSMKKPGKSPLRANIVNSGTISSAYVQRKDQAPAMTANSRRGNFKSFTL